MTNTRTIEGSTVYFPYSHGEYDQVEKVRIADRPAEEDIKEGTTIKTLRVRKNFDPDSLANSRIAHEAWVDLEKAYMVRPETFEVKADE